MLLKEDAVQANTIEQECTKIIVVDLISNDTDLQKFTGVPSFDVFNKIVKHVEHFMTARANLLTSSRVLLVLVRLKTGLSFNCLSSLFGVSESSVHRCFCSTLPVLAQVMKAAIPWPSKEEVMLNMPLCFTSFPRESCSGRNRSTNREV